jgi:hypothetical protein
MKCLQCGEPLSIDQPTLLRATTMPTLLALPVHCKAPMHGRWTLQTCNSWPQVLTHPSPAGMKDLSNRT